MIFGKHKEELIRLREEVAKLRAEQKQIKDNLPQIQEMFKLLSDLNQIGAGLIKVQRIHPDSFFLVNPK